MAWLFRWFLLLREEREERAGGNGNAIWRWRVFFQHRQKGSRIFDCLRCEEEIARGPCHHDEKGEQAPCDSNRSKQGKDLWYSDTESNSGDELDVTPSHYPEFERSKTDSKCQQSCYRVANPVGLSRAE